MPSEMLYLTMRKFLKKEIDNSKIILDVGCGDGATALFLISFLNCHIDRIDLDKGKVRRANKKFRHQNTRGVALCAVCNVMNADKKFQRNTFDSILFIHTFHHLSDLGIVMSKIRHLLKSTGRIFIVEYHSDYGENRDNCSRFSSKKIQSMLSTAHFKHIRNHNVHKNLVIITAAKTDFKEVKK